MRDSLSACRPSRRRYGVVTSSDRHRLSESPPRSTTTPSQEPWSTPPHIELPKNKKKPPTPQFYVPSVLLPQEAAQSPTVHKIHILGEDERSKFIAHALSSVYDSVEMLSWKGRPTSRYGNVQKLRPGCRRDASLVESNLVKPRVVVKGDKSRISQLVVTGRGCEAAVALESVKDRIDNHTTICLMNDGLGVLEDVKKKIFEGIEPSPKFLLGYMSHRLVYNRTYGAVTQLRGGETKLAFAGAPRIRVADMQKVESRPNLVSTLGKVRDLRCTLTSYDQWLRFKLPSVIFDSVVEPICVLLEMPYQGILQNSAAQRLMQGLLSEIITVLEQMPELEGSTVIRDYVESKGVRKFMYSRIRAKRSDPSQLARRIEKGLPTDIEYLNGFFLRRGWRLGVDMRMNKMMREMVKAKHSQAIERLNSYVPIEETSIPSHLASRYRTLRQ